MTLNSQPLVKMTTTQAQLYFASWTKDILIYVVVLNLFVEYVDVMVIDSFTISIFTAILLKVLLDVILGVEHRVADFFKHRPGKVSKILRVLFTWLILFLSKFMILETVDLLFGDHVELGGFFGIFSLALTLMVVRQIVENIYVNLGHNQPVGPENV